MHLPETLASRPLWSVTTCVSSPMGLGYLHQARRKQLPHLSQLYMVKAARNQRGFYAPPGAINTLSQSVFLERYREDWHVAAQVLTPISREV